MKVVMEEKLNENLLLTLGTMNLTSKDKSCWKEATENKVSGCKNTC